MVETSNNLKKLPPKLNIGTVIQYCKYLKKILQDFYIKKQL